MVVTLVATALAAPPLEVNDWSPRVVITAPNGERTVCRRARKHPPGCSGSEAWYEGPGVYTVATVRPTFRAEVRMDGTETALEVKASERMLHVFRHLPPPAGLSVEPEWSGKVGDLPVYRVHNGTDQLFWYFAGEGVIGVAERREAEGWKRVSPRVECGNSYHAGKLEPGQEHRSVPEGRNRVDEAVSTGEYRYVLPLYDARVDFEMDAVAVRAVTELIVSFTLAE